MFQTTVNLTTSEYKTTIEALNLLGKELEIKVIALRLTSGKFNSSLSTTDEDKLDMVIECWILASQGYTPLEIMESIQTYGYKQ